LRLLFAMVRRSGTLAKHKGLGTDM